MEEKIKELGLEMYQPGEDHDIALFNWWVHLNESGDFDRVFTRPTRALSTFLANFTMPTMLFFIRDDDGIWLAVWFSPIDRGAGGAFMNYWARKNMRTTQKHYKCSRFIYDMATEYFPVVVGVTRHEGLLRIHRKIGYNILGQIPKVLDGEDAWLVYLTRGNWLRSEFRNSPAAKEK